MDDDIKLTPWYDKNVANFSNMIFIPDKNNDIEYKSNYKFNSHSFNYKSYQNYQINNDKINYKKIEITTPKTLTTTTKFSITSMLSDKQKNMIKRWAFIACDLYNFCVKEYNKTKNAHDLIYNKLIDENIINDYLNNIKMEYNHKNNVTNDLSNNNTLLKLETNNLANFKSNNDMRLKNNKIKLNEIKDII